MPRRGRRPELTEERFRDVPKMGRCFRSGPAVGRESRVVEGRLGVIEDRSKTCMGSPSDVRQKKRIFLGNSCLSIVPYQYGP